MTSERNDPLFITRTWLRFDDCRCVRGNHWAGPEHDEVYVIPGEGLVCPDHVTDDEKRAARNA